MIFFSKYNYNIVVKFRKFEL